MALPKWYLRIEPEVRQVVYKLRNAGINTVSSCGHEMTIGFDVQDESEDIATIFNVLGGMGLTDWRVGIGGHHQNGRFDRVGAIVLRPHKDGDANVVV